MPALITLTLNPALDLATTIDRVAPTHKLRCGPIQRYAGGGGINVARVLHRLGADVQAWALAGGAAGAQVRQLLADEGVPTVLQPIAGDTPGTPDDFYAPLARALKARGVRVAIDTSGPALAAALQAGVALVKPSLRELQEVMQQPLAHAADWCQAARSLVQSGAAGIVALSVGDQGAVLATPEGVWQAPALHMAATTGTTGAGDCFLAALVWALDRGDAPAEALRWGVAAGAAALLHPGTTLAQAADVQRLVRHVPAPVAMAMAA